MSRRPAAVLSLAALLSIAAVAPAQDKVTVENLLPQMTDLRALAEFPSPAYTNKQFSSYDRASKKPGDDAWFANADAGQYLRVEQTDGRAEHVMMDAQGPGAIVRIWSANPKGIIRFYLDGATTPTFEADLTKLLDGQIPNFPKPLAGERARGHNLYFPFPYARSCKVTVSPGEHVYYHVNYRTYPAGTAVETFDPRKLDALRPAIQRVAAQLENPRDAGVKPERTQKVDLTLAPGQEATLAFFDYTAAISEVLLKLDATDPAQREQSLRQLLLTASFDNRQTVSVPLGDFFGTAPGVNPYASLPAGMTPDGQMWSHWIMPFVNTATLKLKNLGPTPAKLSGHVGTVPHAWTDRSMHFHATFHVRNQFPTLPRIDWTALAARGGRGLFAGVHMAIDNPVRAWWGEGDEKIYVDGETFPSTFGTGTEDYFGYAWCDPTPFTHAYHNQPRCDGPGNYGRTSVNRFHVLDAIPFTRDFKFDIEIWHWRKCDVNVATTAYWYGAPGATSDAPAYSAADLAVRPVPAFVPFRVKGAIEGEKMKIVSKVGTADAQGIDETSDDHHLWWRGGQKPGDQLVLSFDAPKPGRYQVRARFLKAHDYGTHTLAFNSGAPSRPIDFYNNGVVLSDELDLGTHTLTEKDNRLTVTVTGANPKAVKAYMFGLDYLLLKPTN